VCGCVYLCVCVYVRVCLCVCVCVSFYPPQNVYAVHWVQTQASAVRNQQLTS